jgi:hypothetical protein
MNRNVEKILVLLALTCAAAAAQAAPTKTAPAVTSHGRAPDANGLSAWGILPWSGVGIGGRYMISLPTDSLLPGGRIRDRFALEFGADLIHYSYHYDYYGYPYYNSRYDYSWTQLLPVFGVMWNVFLTPQFVVYPKAELGYGIGWYSSDNPRFNRSYANHGGVDLNVAGGALFTLKNGLSLRGEIGWSGLKAGVGWLF